VKVAFRDHDGKGRLIGEALTVAGHQLTASSPGDVALIDADVPFPPYARYCAAHRRVLLYPHGAGHPFASGRHAPHPHTIHRFVPGPGQVEVFRRCGYQVPVTAIGWPFSDLAAFTPTVPRRILFAPQHPLSDGFMPAGQRELNRRLHDMLAATGADVSVRYIPMRRFGLEHLGISHHKAVTYQPGSRDVADGVAAIDAADVVVAAEGTFAHMAVARGKPTLMFSQVAPHEHLSSDKVEWRSPLWKLYRDYTRYPLDIDHVCSVEDLLDVIDSACVSDAAIAEWRSLFIGDQFNPATFAAEFDRICG
jgi:hypothetical protein